jgi:hypothetical protein
VTRLPTTTSLGLSSTSHSSGPTLPTRSSRCASTCMTPVSPISQLHSASFGTSRAPSITACFFVVPLRQTSSSTMMLTGPVVSTLASPLQAMRCFWATTSSPDPRSVKTSSPVQALRQSTTSWPTMWQRCVGFVSSLWSSTAPCRGPPWSTTTTLASSTSPPTPFNTSASSILRLMFTLSVSTLPSGTFVSSTSRRLLSSPISSSRGCPPRCS